MEHFGCLMSGFAAGNVPEGADAFREEEQDSLDELAQAPKVLTQGGECIDGAGLGLHWDRWAFQRSR